jgi:hypothetical protein
MKNKPHYNIMMDQMEYVMRDINCQQALDELKEDIFLREWIEKYEKLKKKISNEPEGLPSIPSCHCGGVRYASIAEFHSIYESLSKYVNV